MRSSLGLSGHQTYDYVSDVYMVVSFAAALAVSFLAVGFDDLYGLSVS